MEDKKDNESSQPNQEKNTSAEPSNNNTESTKVSSTRIEDKNQNIITETQMNEQNKNSNKEELKEEKIEISKNEKEKLDKENSEELVKEKNEIKENENNKEGNEKLNKEELKMDEKKMSDMTNEKELRDEKKEITKNENNNLEKANTEVLKEEKKEMTKIENNKLDNENPNKEEIKKEKKEIESENEETSKEQKKETTESEKEKLNNDELNKKELKEELQKLINGENEAQEKINSEELKEEKTKNENDKLDKESSDNKESKDDKKNEITKSETNKSDITNKEEKKGENDSERFLNDFELIKEMKKDNYKKCYFNRNFCDFRTREDKSWRIGLITEILEDSLVVEDIINNRKYQTKIDNSSLLSYFRKYTEVTEDNTRQKRDKKEALLNRLKVLEDYIKTDKLFTMGNAWEIYYFLHSKVYFGLDSAMKINSDRYGDYDEDGSNEGCEESFRIILCILFFLTKYFKFLLDNKDEFINYQNNIENTECIDLKIVNKKYSFFSFFEESINLLNKIFANSTSNLDWFIYFEDEIIKFIPSIRDRKKKPNKEFYPLYEEEKEEEENQEEENEEEKKDEKKDEKTEKSEKIEKNNNQTLLKRICLENAYNHNTTFTTDGYKIKASIIAYFIDYFNYYNGFSYLFQLCYCSDLIKFKHLKALLTGLSSARAMTGSYDNICKKEKKKLKDFINSLIDNLNENTFKEYNNDNMLYLVQKIPQLTIREKDETQIIFEHLYLKLILKTFLLSKKLDQKIAVLNTINEVLKSIEGKNGSYSYYNRITIKNISLEEFCVECKNKKIIPILFNDQSVHEEIIKRLNDIMFVMYKNNFGYSKTEDNEDKIKSEKKMIFNVLFNKILESEQYNSHLIKNIQNLICDFCNILSEEDKLFVYEEIKKYLDKSIEKKGIPVKDNLLFVIDYTLKAIKTKKFDNKKDKKKETEKDNINEIEEKEKANVDNINLDNNQETKEKKDNKKEENIIIKIDDDNYFGLNLLLDYLLEEQYSKYNMTNEQKIELINTSIKGIIQIIENCKQKEFLLEHMLFKVTSAINNSKDVIQFLKLLERMKNNNELENIINKILEEHSNNYALLPALMSDMSRYLSLINNDEADKENDKERKKEYEGLFNNELNINLRLELIFILLQKNINEENLNNFNKNVVNPCERNNFANMCLNKFIYNDLNKFDNKFIQFLYDNLLLSKGQLTNVNDYQFYKLCNEIIKKINENNKIFYFMNNKDLAILNCRSEKEIKGIDLLWEFLIKTNKDNIRNDVTDLLANIFYGIRIENKEKREEYWANFVKSIYDKLDEIIIKKDDTNEKGNAKSIQGIISLIKKIENKFANKGDIIDNIKQISKEMNLVKKNEKQEKEENNTEDFKKICFSGKVYNSDKVLEYDLKIDNTEYFYAFRYKLSSFYKIPVNLIKVVVDQEKYNILKTELQNIEFDLYNDFDNTCSKINDIEQIIKNKGNIIIDYESPLMLKIEVLKENPELKYIKSLIKDFPKLIELLKRKNSEYLLDIWCLIKEENIKLNENIIKNIKTILNEKNSDINSIFNFEDTNIYYISYILFHLYNVINELNLANKKFINEQFLTSKIWEEKIKNIKIEKSEKPQLGEICEKNNIINYLLSIFVIIAQKTDNEDNKLFILNKSFYYYYQTIKECISINLRDLPSTDGVSVNEIENLYDSNISKIKEIIQNNLIYFINNLLSCTLNTEDENNIKFQFEFLIREGLLKNGIFALNQKLKSFLKEIIDDKIFNQQDPKIIQDFYLYLLNLFFDEKSNEKTFNCIREISLNKKIEISRNTEKYENNIKLYFEIIIIILNKSYSLIKNKFNFRHYVKEIILKKINDPIIDGIPLECSYHEIIFGGHCKILFNLISKSENYKELLDLNEEEEIKLKHYLFNDIIMNKCNENIFTENNINNYREISINSSYAFKEAVNLFVYLYMENIENENEKAINYYFDKLTNLHKLGNWKGNNISDWKLEYKDNNKLSPYVGLKNLGCTCYMNSLLQVFFNIIPFRESLLKCECNEERKNSLYQIKKVFYSLKYLQINYYTPNDFPYNYDDEILDVHLQMDVDEFFGNILDKIENRLKNTKNENLVKYFFQGRQNDMLTFQGGCTHHRSNANNFYSIQLQVQNKKNIYESLDALTEGELMNGDNCIFCPDCNNKFPAVKSQNFKTLPRMLIFVLKRFEFNSDTMKKVKINDYYEFPLELNMTKYISEKKADENLNKYSLKSVVVHMGNCEGGHYYAYIKDKNEEWYEFNDTQVTPIDIGFLSEEVFGGEETFNNNGNELTSQKNRSAYLLFYEKIDQTDCEQFNNIEAINSYLNLSIKNEKGDNVDNINENNNEEKQENNQNINEIENGGTKIKNVINEEEETKVQDKNFHGMKDILDNINKEMFKYYLNKKLFSNEYQYFILEFFLNTLNYYYMFDLTIFLMHLCRNSPNRQLQRNIVAINSNLNLYINKKKIIFISKKNKAKNNIKYNTPKIEKLFQHFIIYFYNIFLRTKDKEYLGGMIDLIKFLINDKSECANYLIEEFCNKNVIIEYLINCPLYEIKKLIVGILYCAMTKSVSEYKYRIITEDNTKKNKNDKKQAKIQSIIDDEEYARKLSENINGKENYNILNSNPLEYENIPKNLLKLIYNILHVIRDNGYGHLNEYRFLYFTIYRFSIISSNTREFLINKCRLFELLCLYMHKRHATYSYDTKAIVDSTYIGPYTVSHQILSNDKKQEEQMIEDKVGKYRNENYMYMLFFYLLSYVPESNKKPVIKEDAGYSLDNKDFVMVLLNNIRTKQDAYCFSNFINEKSKNSKSKINTVFDCLTQYLGQVDNNENINYNYNNYTGLVRNNMNEELNEDDPGMNPKYLLYILKKFISVQKLKNDYVTKGIKLIFSTFWENHQYYSFSIMLIDFIIELFSTCLRGLVSTFSKDLQQLIKWLGNNPISPTLYPIRGLALYKLQKKKYDNNIPEEVLKEFEEKEYMSTQKRIEEINKIIKKENIDDNKNYETEMNTLDYTLIIGDIIIYDGKEVVIEEALDELVKITVVSNNKNGKNIDEKTMWIETDDPKIEIKEIIGN